MNISPKKWLMVKVFYRLLWLKIFHWQNSGFLFGMSMQYTYIETLILFINIIFIVYRRFRLVIVVNYLFRTRHCAECILNRLHTFLNAIYASKLFHISIISEKKHSCSIQYNNNSLAVRKFIILSMCRKPISLFDLQFLFSPFI